MVISIDDSLVDLYNQLKKLGYDVHKISENITSDAYIYSEKTTPLYKLNSMIEAKEGGSLMINCDNMDLKDIIYSIHHKTYTPLF